MSTAESGTPSTPERPQWVSIAVGVAIVVAIVVLFLVLRPGGDDAKTASTPAPAGPTAASPPPATAATPTSLAALQTTLKHPIYWVGAQASVTYELTQTPNSVYVRYLTGGAKPGDGRAKFVTVGTYEQDDPFATVTAAAKRSGATTRKLENGGLGVVNKAVPNSWYVAYPDSKELIEVFSPDPARATALVRSGRVVPVKG